MIKYEIYSTPSANEPFHTFYTMYQYSEKQRIFVEKDEQLFSCTINSITGNSTKEEHVVRLNCHVIKYVEKEF